MNSIMIVDDEPGVRASIMAKIDWEQAGFRIVGEAANGEEALALLEGSVRCPDVLLTDIRMPVMDGIELIKACAKKYPRLRLVVLSGHSDYPFMQAAIHAGVKDYLLKPVSRRDLTALLAKLSEELQAERADEQQHQVEELKRGQQLQMLQETMLLQLVKEQSFGLSMIRERLSQLQLSELADDDVLVRFATVEMRIPHGRLQGGPERAELLQMAFQMLCKETAQSFDNVYPLYDASHPSMMHFLVRVGGEGAADKEADVVEALLKQVRTNIRQYLRVECVIGTGETVQGIRQFKNGYSSSMLSWSRSTIDSTMRGGGRQVTDLMEVFTPEVERQLVVAVENMDVKSFGTILSRIMADDIDYAMFSFTFLASRILLSLHAVAKKYESGTNTLSKRLWDCQMTIRDFHSRDEIVRQLDELARLVMQEVQKARCSSGQSIASAVQHYVDDNYAYELTLSSLAAMFHLNETYLSGLFKQHAGVTFSEYITTLRMTKAGQLLTESDLKLTDIAMLVGISSSSYFSTSFKKHYGMSPKEYREQRR